MKNRPFAARLGFALKGIGIVWRRERSFGAQLTLGLGAVAVTVAVQPGAMWIAILLLAAALVLTLEMINSALEYMIDHLHPDIAPEIGHAKDAAAGAVLIASLAALAVGALMLWSVMRPITWTGFAFG